MQIERGDDRDGRTDDGADASRMWASPSSSTSVTIAPCRARRTPASGPRRAPLKTSASISSNDSIVERGIRPEGVAQTEMSGRSSKSCSAAPVANPPNAELVPRA